MAGVINVKSGELPIIPVRKFDLNILAHFLHDIFVADALPLRGVKSQIVNDAKKAGAAQYLLTNAVQLMLNVGVDVRYHVLLRNRWLLNQNECARSIGRMEQPIGPPHQQPYKEKWQQKLPAPAADHSLDLVEVDWFARLF